MQILLLLVVGLSANASGGRSLPSGENNPAVVERIFSSPRGEVQFVAMQGGHSAWLRAETGNLSGLKETRGHSSCDEWLISNKAEAIPSDCEFVFHDENSGVLSSVRSEEMNEATLFQSARGAMRGAIVAL